MKCVNLSGTCLKFADLSGADLRKADFFNANLNDAILSGVKIDSDTIGLTIACPEEGAFIGYKKADNKIVVLEISADAKRSSATTYKCRCSKAKVLRIENLDGTPADEKFVASTHKKNFIYEIGKTVEVPDFDENRWMECSRGIHFFINREFARTY